MLNNTKSLRQLNTQTLLNALKHIPHATKNQLAQLTQLSVATCGNILNDCILSGKVVEIELSESTGGRPSRQFVYNKNYCYTASLYPRHENKHLSIFLSVNNLLGESIYQEHVECDLLILDELTMTIQHLLNTYPLIRALSFGIPGVVDQGVIGICDIEDFIDFDIQTFFQNKFNLPVTIDNDVNLAAYGYYHKYNLPDMNNVAYIYFPVDGNPGAGIIINGEILHGFSNFAGEVSYMPTNILRSDQGIIQKENLKFAQYVATIIMNINCVINPKSIVLSGYCFNDELLTLIKENLYTYSRTNYVPTLIFEEDLHDSYLLGLVEKALNLLTKEI